MIYKSQRVGVFIDTQNIYHSAQNLYKSNVNFGNILKDVVDERQLIKAIAYTINTESKTEEVFYDALEKIGIDIKSKDLQIFINGAKKADWDVGIAIDIIASASKLDTVVLLSGDGDFVPLVEYLKYNFGTRVEIVSFGQTTSGKLIEAVDAFFDLSKNTRRYLMRKPRAKKPRS